MPDRTLVSELEDAMRRQHRRRSTNGKRWERDREAFINLAAWLMTVVETGDANAAKEAQDQSADTGSTA